AALARGALESLCRGVQIAGAVIDDGDAHRLCPGSGKRPMTSRPVGGPRRTGAAGGADGAGAALWPRAAHCEKKRCSAPSWSSPTTKPSVSQPRRVSVQRRRLEASKPTSSATTKAARLCTQYEGQKKASPAET